LSGIAVPMFHSSIRTPLLLMTLAFSVLFVTLHVAAMRNEILRQRVQRSLLLQATRADTMEFGA
jgi:heme exporter protein C